MYPLFMDTREVNLMNKKIILLPLAALTLGAVSCGPKGGSSANEISVCFFNGGYGTSWANKVASDFEAETGIKVKVKADGSIDTKIEDMMKKPRYDIIMSHGINWRTFAARGQLENLNDLYAMENEDGKTFADRCLDDAKKASKIGDDYYKVCWTRGAGGFVYNVDMFKQNHWEVPKTYEELATLCETIYNADIEVGGDYVVPIVWTKDRAYYWDYIVYEWWAQLAGIEKIEHFKTFLGDDGTLEKGYEVFNPNTNLSELKQAYQKWFDLIPSHKNYCNANAATVELTTAQSLFISGKAAMIPYAQWAKNEIQENQRVLFPFEIAMMETPKVSSTASGYNYNVGFGDSIIIPKNRDEGAKASAKKFINYLATKKGCKTFVQEARGAFLAFDYSPVDLGDLANDKFVKSVYDKITKCTNFNLDSDAPVARYNSSIIKGAWYNDEYKYTEAFSDPDNTSYQPTTLLETLFSKARSQWPSLISAIPVD